MWRQDKIRDFDNLIRCIPRDVLNSLRRESMDLARVLEDIFFEQLNINTSCRRNRGACKDTECRVWSTAVQMRN